MSQQINVQVLTAGPRTVQPLNAQVGVSYTLQLSDAGRLVELTNGSPVTVTVPPAVSVAFPVGTRIDLVQGGAGRVTVQGGSGVTVQSTPTATTRAQHSGASLWYRGSNVWRLFGDLA